MSIALTVRTTGSASGPCAVQVGRLEGSYSTLVLELGADHHGINIEYCMVGRGGKKGGEGERLLYL